jgi:hypothetical protein
VESKIVPEKSWSEPKWDLRSETRRGKCTRAIKEPRRAPLSIKMTSHCMFLPTPLLSAAVCYISYLRLNLTHLSSHRIADKVSPLAVPNRNRLCAGEDSG